MIEQLKNILLPEGEEISALLSILSEQEKTKLNNYFDQTIDQTHDISDITTRFFALNALFIYIKNNPSIESEIQANGIETETIAIKIYELATILFESKKSWENYFYLSAYAVLAEKQTLLTQDNTLSSPDGFLERTLEFIIQFSFPVRSNHELNQRKANLEKLKQEFASLQKAENIHSEQQLYQIIALSNVVGLCETLQHYLLEGNGSNIEASINHGMSNATRVFAETGNRTWELICSLLRFVLHKHYEISVWTVANRVPFFKDFITQQLERGTFHLSLFPSQKAVLSDILASRQSTVMSMPTSTGKTLLAELKILYTRSLYQNNCLCVYIAPTNALVNQTLRRLKNSFSDLKVEQLLPYNHFDDLEEELIGEQPDILVSTPEKLNFLLKNREQNLLDRLRLVVIDEAHNISDTTRGSVWEFLLASLKQDDEQLSYLLLTPFIKNKEELAKWLSSDSSVARSVEWTPTKQYVAYHSLHRSQTVSKINYLPSARNSIIQEDISIDLSINPQTVQQALNEDAINDTVRNAILVEKYAKQQGCILILHRGIGSAEKLAQALSEKFNFPPDKQKLDYAQELIKQELGDGHNLLALLDKGIAFHHSQLPPLVKEAIENLVSNDAIKVLVATTTLAQGMNFPIKTVIFETLTLGGGNNSKALSHSEFWNIAGRAGRAYKDTEGHIVLGWKGSDKKTKERLESFISQDIEDTVSSLKNFFDALDENQEIDYQFIKDNPTAQNFLHYLNHLMNISHQCNPDAVKRQDIVNMLTNSLYFKQADDLLETHKKLVDFSQQYIDSIKNKQVSQLKLADTLGITDISLATIIGITQENRPLLSACLRDNNQRKLAVIINAIHRIPELKISLGRQTGIFDPRLVAGILLGWINGETIPQIARAQSLELNECSGYIFSRLKNYIPWGMAIYQNISNDENKLLPSYAFYGVKDEPSVKLSFIGVPRFALSRVKNTITDKTLYEDIKKLRTFVKKSKFDLETAPGKNDIVNRIIQDSVL